MEYPRASQAMPLIRNNEDVNSAKRDRSDVDASLSELDNMNRELDAITNELEVRLAPVLRSEKMPAPDNRVPQAARPSYDAQLPESIASQADCVRARIQHIRYMISRLAI